MPCQQVESEKSFVPNRLKQLRTLVICLSLASLLGCGQKPVDDIEAANKAGRPIFVRIPGQELEFPAAIEFDGQTWIRGREMKELLNDSIEWTYHGSDPNVKVQYTQFPKYDHDYFKETFVTYRRYDSQSRWKESGKQRLIETNGAWYDSINDPSDDGKSIGPYEYSYASGVLKFSGNTRASFKVGPAEGYYPDGALWWKGEYDDDSPLFHEMRFWGPDGNEMQDLKRDEKLEQYDRWREMRSDPQAS